ncbi:MAG: hypothetical protein K8S54_17790 [Spirochaetia bacterium]|nr:hypothetical protein [Spirochaetia bacterium]
MSDSWDNLSDFEQVALARAEEKYAVAKPQVNPFESFPAIKSARIFGANFFAYQGKLIGRADLIWIHSDRTRFNGLCKLASAIWIPELRECAEAVCKAEESLNQNASMDDSLEWNLQSFGIQCSYDSYILGYGDISSPMVVNRRFFLDFFEFVGQSLISIDPDERLSDVFKALRCLSEKAQMKHP